MKLAWMHPDCLSADWLPPGSRAFFVFDDDYLAACGWGLKRIMFVYETLLELPVEIYRGSTVQLLAELAADEGVVTVDTPDPWLLARIAELRERVAVDVIPPPVFVELKGHVNLQRFSRYWSKAEAKLLD
ncbi:MAG: hypothetical protein NTV70_16255 [Acidobacteria bacterium]|nr:hypothetical protein [Acidobacteriota bacterium]